MKLFDIIYYILSIGFMVLSVFKAPQRFIEHEMLAGWLWLLTFVFFLFTLLYEALEQADADQYIKQIQKVPINNDIRYYNSWVEAATDRQKGDRIYYNPDVRLYYSVKPIKRNYWGF